MSGQAGLRVPIRPCVIGRGASLVFDDAACVPRQSRNQAGGVYFIYAPAAEAVEIGVSVDTRNRIRKLQSSSPCEMIILGVLVGADATLEATFHERFKHIRLHGEWFRANEELLDFVDLLMALQDAIALAGTLRAVGGR